MLVGFIGDVHGRVLLALAALATCQVKLARRFDLMVQVGDMGAYPDLDRVDPATDRYLAVDPSEADFSRMLPATGARAERLRGLRRAFTRPIHFIRGNHEDVAWLANLPVDAETGTARVDPFDLFRFVRDGSVLVIDGLRIAFLGGEGDDPAAEGAIDPRAHQELIDLGPDRVNLLVTHDNPYGISRGYYGDVQGSHRITALIEALRPRWHVAGHLGQQGPLHFGPTTFLCLGHVVASPLWHPEATGLLPGCVAVLDTATAELQPIVDPWLTRFATPIDFDGWFQAFTRGELDDAPGGRDG